MLVEKNGKIFPYIPTRLKKICTFNNLPEGVLRDFTRDVKFNTNAKMKFIIDEVKSILINNKYIKFKGKNMECEKIGYDVQDYLMPQLIFGNNRSNKYPKYGLMNTGVYDSKKINVEYFIDSSITKINEDKEKVISFTKKLENYSKKWC